MSFLFKLIICLIWSAVMYYATVQLNKSDENINLNPWKYSILTFLFSTACGASFLVSDVLKAKGKTVGHIIALCVGVLILLFQIVSIFA